MGSGSAFFSMSAQFALPLCCDMTSQQAAHKRLTREQQEQQDSKVQMLHAAASSHSHGSHNFRAVLNLIISLTVLSCSETQAAALVEEQTASLSDAG